MTIAPAKAGDMRVRYNENESGNTFHVKRP